MLSKSPKRAKTKTVLAAAASLILGFSLLQQHPGAVHGSGEGWNYLPLVLKDWPPPTPTPGPGRVVISEVLYDPSTSTAENNYEWIEIFNIGGRPFDLSDCKIGDEEREDAQPEGMEKFPGGTSIRPGQALVIAVHAKAFRSVYGRNPDFELNSSDGAVPDLTKYASWAEEDVELVNVGDEVLLLCAGDVIADAVYWGNSSYGFYPPVKRVADGHSIERFPVTRDTDSAADWREKSAPDPWGVVMPTPTPTPTLIPTATATPTPTKTPIPTVTPETPVEGRLLVSEVMYDPHGDEPDREWVELFNTGAEAISLNGHKIGDAVTQTAVGAMMAFPAGHEIAPQEAVVVVCAASDFIGYYNFAPDFEMVETDPSVPNMLPYGAWGTGCFNLNNEGDALILLDETDQIADGLSWGVNTEIINPPVPLCSEEKSLERSPADQDTDSAGDWRCQSIPYPGVVE